MKWNDNKLTPEIRKQLKQGTKVKFKWHGSDMLYTGRIEVSEWNELFFVAEFNYKDDVLIYEGLRYYNSIDSFNYYTFFEIL